MKLRLLASLVLVTLMFTLVSSVAAQDYSFSLDEEIANVYYNSDGTVAIDYVFAFTNEAGGHVIDFVDVGVPNNEYDWNSISADVNGNKVGLSTDFYGEGSSGFSVDLGAYAIQPGQSGTVHVFIGSVGSMFNKDDQEPDTYASAEFSPVWFDSAYVHGSTNLSVSIHLPPGVQVQEPRYHPARGGWPCATEPEAVFDAESRITYTWACVSANGHSQYTFGASFPKQYIPVEAIVTTSAPSFDISGVIAWVTSNLFGFCCFGFFVLMFVGAPILGTVNERNRKLKYLPPKIQIEGHGIKRGLTAVEAAILMEQPLDKIMTMILFGAVKKNAATVVTRDPLKLELAQPLPEDLHDYENEFLTAFADENLVTRRKALQELTVNLVKSISEKMKGFSRKETVDFYRAIMERAWQQIEAGGTPEVKSQMFDEALEWTMLDKEYDDRTRRVFTGPVYMPMWWGRYDPAYRPSASSVGAGGRTAAPISTGSGRVSVPGSALAASMVTSVQGFSSKVIGDLHTFTSGVTSRTNPVPKTSSSSYKGGGGGGHSCACACACAGCACACAGGGR